MIVHCKNILGDGTVLYVDYEVDDAPIEDDTEATESDYIDALKEVGIDINQQIMQFVIQTKIS